MVTRPCNRQLAKLMAVIKLSAAKTNKCIQVGHIDAGEDTLATKHRGQLSFLRAEKTVSGNGCGAVRRRQARPPGGLIERSRGEGALPCQLTRQRRPSDGGCGGQAGAMGSGLCPRRRQAGRERVGAGHKQKPLASF
jgi:hypothetical protein